MALGGAVGQNLAGVMNGMMPTASTPPPQTPPMPTISYYVAINGQSTGPYDFSVLSQMVSAKTLTKESLVWKQGMANWTQAGLVQELQQLFASPSSPPGLPPIPPTIPN